MFENVSVEKVKTYWLLLWKGKRVLEIGCGIGTDTIKLRPPWRLCPRLQKKN